MIKLLYLHAATLVLQSGQDAARGTESGTDEPEENFRFSGIKLSGSAGVEINEYLGEGGVVKIPTSLGGKPVISIDDYVFSESGVTDVYFEAEGFVYIESYAFAGCTSLNSVVIKGNENTELRGHAFEDCTNLTSVVLSEEITGFWEAVFWGTPWLENKKQEAPLVIVNNVLIDATLYTGDLVIPDGIHTISGQYGFAGDLDIVITHRGKEYTYEELEELDSIIWSEYLNSLP